MASATTPKAVRQTREFSDWFASLRDQRAKARVLARIRRLSLGNFGDVKAVGDGVRELRIDYGTGYRVYFAQSGRNVVLILIGGDKSRQEADIAKAREIAAAWERD